DERLEGVRVPGTESLDERAVAVGRWGRLRGWLLPLPEKLGEKPGAAPEAGPSPRQVAEQADAGGIDELEAADVELKCPLFAQDCFARHSQFLRALVRQATLDSEGVACRAPRDPHHRDRPATQAMCLRSEPSQRSPKPHVIQGLAWAMPIRRRPRGGCDISRIYDVSRRSAWTAAARL